MSSSIEYHVQVSDRRARMLALLVAISAATACAPFSSSPPTHAAAVATPAPEPSAAPAAPPPPVEGGSVAGRARSFSTRLATYTAASFDTLPGWGRDDFIAGWPAFLGSCQSLARRKTEWNNLCSRAQRVDGKSEKAIRSFYEHEFSVYQIRDDDRRVEGVVTGYFEPEIQGSRRYAPPFVYPVYATPTDMLMLDTRTLPKGLQGTVAARVVGQKVQVQKGLSTRDMNAPDLYALDLGNVERNTLDRRARMRIDGRRLVPYYTRQEIETRGAPNAAVLAFVRDANALYELQVQGSGRIRFQDEGLIRIAYAEQNGHPFRPMVARASNGKSKGVRVRGAFVELSLDDDADQPDVTDAVLTRGFALVRPARSGPVAVPGQKAPAGIALGTGNTDPSYVFFKEEPQNSTGVVGALGVPLTAGRSIAVDPRSTPLGYPVFVSTRDPASGAPIQRLTLAQDTGGAIRGAVRADYFFGAGADAANAARRMKQRGQMWVLLPRGMTVAAVAPGSGSRTRGAGAGNASCLVADDESCAEGGDDSPQ